MENKNEEKIGKIKEKHIYTSYSLTKCMCIAEERKHGSILYLFHEQSEQQFISLFILDINVKIAVE